MPTTHSISIASLCALAATLTMASCTKSQSQESPKPDAAPEPKGESRILPTSPAPESLADLAVLTPFLDGLSQPLGLYAAPGEEDGRLFIVEKTGHVRIVQGGEVQDAPFLDLSSRVSDAGEQGLLGLAFHPRFAENGRLFVNFTDTEGTTRVVGFEVDSADRSRVNPGSEKDLFHVEQPFANHNAGHLTFGPDGLLYVAMGDGGSGNDPQNNAQRDDTLLGKLLRLDVNAETPQPEVIGKGLRNPWRYSFDSQTGDLFIADVGQNRIEEVNVVAADDLVGHNFGWNILEGTQCLRGDGCSREGMTMPVLEYTHDDGCSITGGSPYRGEAIPELSGHYFYSDFCTGLLRSFRWSEKGGVVDHFDWKSALDPNGALQQIAAFGVDSEGELYLISLAGSIWRLNRRD